METDDPINSTESAPEKTSFLPDRLLAAQVPAHLPHAGPRLRPSLAAHQAQQQHQLRLLLLVAPLQPRVHGSQQVAAEPAVADPPHQDHVRVPARRRRLHRPAPARDLEQQLEYAVSKVRARKVLTLLATSCDSCSSSCSSTPSCNWCGTSSSNVLIDHLINV